MTQEMKAFLEELDKFEERIPLDELVQRLKQLKIVVDDVEDYIQFDPTRYRRNLLHEGPGYQALVLCWRAGQRSPIHDHVGSSCGVRVIKGVMTETSFTRTARGMIVPKATGELRAGQTCGSQDADIHQVSNLQDNGEPLITLHIYSPPLLTMNVYSLEDGSVKTFHDPIHEFCHGAGI